MTLGVGGRWRRHCLQQSRRAFNDALQMPRFRRLLRGAWFGCWSAACRLPYLWSSPVRLIRMARLSHLTRLACLHSPSINPAWAIVFLLGVCGGCYLAGVRTDAQRQASRQQVAAWQASQSTWAAQRSALHAELERLRDELSTAQAWLDRLERTLALSHGHLVDAKSELHFCERLLETLMTVRKR